jgi:hypothetical protein
MEQKPETIKRIDAIKAAGGPEKLDAWLQANNYSTTPVGRMFPEVPIEDEGLYYEPVDYAGLLRNFTVDSAGRWPVIEAYRLPEAIKSLPPEETARLLGEYLPIVLIDADGREHRDRYHWAHNNDGRYSKYKPLPDRCYAEEAAAALAQYLGGYDFPISHAEAQGFWMKNALLPGGGAIAIQNSANLGERRFYDPQGWERDAYWSSFHTDLFWEAVRAAGWVKQPEYPDTHIAPKPPRSLTYEEVTRIRLHMANAENWRQAGDRYNHREFMPLRELMQAAGLEDLTEGTFKRALKPFLGAFVPTVSPGTRTVSNDDGEPEAMEGLIATLLATPEEQGPGGTIPCSLGNADQAEATAYLASNGNFFLLALAGPPMRIQSNHAVWRTQVRPNKHGRVHPFGWVTYSGESVAYKGAAGDLRTLQIYSPAAIPDLYTSETDNIAIVDQRQRDGDGNLTVAAPEPADFLRTWLTTPLPDIVDIGQLILRMMMARRCEIVLGFNASGLHLYQRGAWEREISAMVREYFEERRAAEAASEAAETGKAEDEPAGEGVLEPA